MKNIKKIILSIAIIFFTSFSFAQMLAPEDPGGEPGGGDDPIGGGAPISGGITVLLSLGLAYGGTKLYKLIHDQPSKDD